MAQTVPEDFTDRQAGLRVFGVIAIVVGALSGCLSIVAVFGVLIGAATRQTPTHSPLGHAQVDPRAAVLGVLMYLGFTALMISLGIGSYRLKRWVRPIMLIVAWAWLLAGVVSLLSLILSADQIMKFMEMEMRRASASAPGAPGAGSPQMPPQFYVALLVSQFAAIAVFCVALPAVFVWFYRSKDTRATLEYHDPDPSWTERCPPPVLGLSLGMALGALAAVSGLLLCIVPVFGVLLTGPAVAAVLVAAAAVMALLARETFHLTPRGYWGSWVVTLLFAASTTATTLTMDIYEKYRLMGTPADQIEAMRESGLINTTAMMTMNVILNALMLGYLAYLHRFFFPRQETEAVQP